MTKSKNILLLILGNAFNGLITLLLVPYMARALDYEDYATYGQILLIIEILKVLTNVAANQYLYVLFSEKKYQQKDMVFNAILINIVLALIGIALIYLTKDILSIKFNNPEIAKNIKIYALSLPFLLIQSTLNLVFYYFNAFKRSIVYQVIINAFRLSAILLAVQVFKSLTLIFVFLLLVNVLSVIIYHIKLPVKYFNGKIQKDLLVNFFKYGYPLGITAIIGILLKRTDAVMVSVMLTPKDYAIYRMGAIEIPFLMTVFSSVMTVMLPNVTKLYHENKLYEIVELKRKAITTSVLAMYPVLIFILVFSKPLLTIYLGEKYSASIPIFVIYNLILFFRVNDYEDILISANKSRIILKTYFAFFILNIILNYLFLKWIGLYGVALSTNLSIILIILFLIYETKSVFPSIFSIFNLKKISLTILISVIFTYSFYFLYINNNLNLVFTFLIYVIITYFILYKIKVFKLKKLLTFLIDRLI